MTAAACPTCGTVVDRRVGNRIAGVWRYCWLCEQCGERWGWINEHQAEARAGTLVRERVERLMRTGKDK